MASAIRAVDELGYADTRVAQITARARVSRRTFYELFDCREDCLVAVIDEVASQIELDLGVEDLTELEWCERVRVGLWRILCFFDREPVMARVCVVHAMAGGPAILARREALLAQLVAVVDEGRSDGAAATTACTSVTAEGVVGAVLTVVCGRLAKRDGEPLVGLLGELMGMIVLPYQGIAAARREQRRPLPAESGVPSASAQVPVDTAGSAEDLLAGLQMRLTYRTARVLESVDEHAGLSNRQVATNAGISDQGQVSKLLTRLERLELLQNTGVGHVKGEPNAWRLTAKGKLVTDSIRVHAQQKTAA